jgi:hypothetical protein
VELAAVRLGIAIRDSKDPEGGHLHVDPADWRTFTKRVKAGETDL